MSLAGQQLLRCPHCISVQPRGPGGELVLEPGENVCASRNCGRTFMGHEAIPEDYPRDGLSREQSRERRLPPRGDAPQAHPPRADKPSGQRDDHSRTAGSTPPAPLQLTFGGMK